MVIPLCGLQDRQGIMPVERIEQQKAVILELDHQQGQTGAEQEKIQAINNICT
jgi:hypothetical protein